VLERTGPAPVKAEPLPEPVHVIYRHEDPDGTLTFSNVPPVSRAKDSR